MAWTSGLLNISLKRRMSVALTHIDKITNLPKMVDISHKSETYRTAHAQVISSDT